MAHKIQSGDPEGLSYYQKGQIASGMIVLITAIAIAILYAMNPSDFMLPVNYPALGTLAAVGGGSLILFVVTSILQCCCTNPKQQEEPVIVADIDTPESPKGAPLVGDAPPDVADVENDQRARVDDAGPAADPKDPIPPIEDNFVLVESELQQSPAQQPSRVVMPQQPTPVASPTPAQPKGKEPACLEQDLAEGLGDLMDKTLDRAKELSQAINQVKSQITTQPKGKEPATTEPGVAQELYGLMNSTMDELETLVLAFNGAYYRVFKKEPQYEAEISQAIGDLKIVARNEANARLNNKPVLAKKMVKLKLPEMLDHDAISDTLTGTVTDFIGSIVKTLVVTTNDDDLATLECLEDLFRTAKEHKAFSTDKELATRFAALQKARQAYDDCYHTQGKESEKLDGFLTQYHEKCAELFNYVVDKTPLSDEQVEAWVPQILNRRAGIIFNLVNFLISYLLGGFDKGGIFENDLKDWAVKTLQAPGGYLLLCNLKVGEKIVDGKKVEGKNLYDRIDELPIEPESQSALKTAVQGLLYCLSNPISYAIHDPMWNSTLMAKFKVLFKQPALIPPQVDSKADWRVYVQEYTAYLKQWTVQLNAMKP